MSNIPTAPGNVGFPQAYGQNQNQQYQHVQQFSQFSQPSAAPLNNAPPNYAANPFPFPTATTSQEPVCIDSHLYFHISISFLNFLFSGETRISNPKWSTKLSI